MIEPSDTQTYSEKGHDMLILRPQRAGRVRMQVWNYPQLHVEWVEWAVNGFHHTRAQAARASYTFPCCGYTGTHSRYCGDE